MKLINDPMVIFLSIFCTLAIVLGYDMQRRVEVIEKKQERAEYLRYIFRDHAIRGDEEDPFDDGDIFYMEVSDAGTTRPI